MHKICNITVKNGWISSARYARKKEKQMKKIILLTATLLLALLCVTSCNTPGDPTPPDEFTLFSPEVKVSLVVGSVTATEDDRRGYDTLRDAISSLLPGGYLIKTDDYNRSEQNPSEIVVGHTSREISELAYEYLDGKDAPDEGYSHFVIYCHDGAVAIAGDGQYAIDAAVEYFINIFLDGKTTLVLDYDLVEYVTFSIAAHEAVLDERYDAEEAEYLEDRWVALAEKIGSEAVDAIKELYDYYGTQWLTWLANLYDPVTGCFYYANSARDYETVTYRGKTYNLLPDAESTCQAIDMLQELGLFRSFNNSWIRALPEDMREKCLAYIQSMQDPDDGYFYHPQWGKAITGATRKGRDLTQCTTIIRKLGGEPLYPTALERIEEGTISSSTSAVISAFMETDAHKSSVILTESTLPDHLKSEEALKTYIDRLIRHNTFHGVGHILSSQTSQIKAAGLGEACIAYLDTFQSPVTGYWGEGVEHEYDKISGIIKIGALYSGLGGRMKHMDKVIDSAINTILSKRVPENICLVYNSWGGLGAAIGNVAATNNPNATDNTNVNVVRAKILQRLPEMIDATIEKLELFKHSDGSFSYWNDGTSLIDNQGVYTSRGLNEGDVNATTVGIYYTINGLFGCLGETAIPMLTYKDYRDFMEIIENAEPVQKKS